MPTTNQLTVAGCAKLVSITIPVTAAPVTLRSLLAAPLAAAVAAFPAGAECMGVDIEQQAAAFNWGDTVACLGLASATDRFVRPLGAGMLDHFVKSTTAGTVSAVAVVYFDRLF